MHVKLKPVVDLPFFLKPLAYFLVPTCDVYLQNSPPYRLLVRFETTESAAAAQTTIAAGLCEQFGATTSIVSGISEADMWHEHETRIFETPGTVVKVAVLPTDDSRRECRRRLRRQRRGDQGDRALGIRRRRRTRDARCEGTVRSA